MYDEGDGDSGTGKLQLIGFTGLQTQTLAAERLLGRSEGFSVLGRVLRLGDVWIFLLYIYLFILAQEQTAF